GGRRGRPRRGRGRVPSARAQRRAGGGVRSAGRDDAAEVHVLLPEADLRPPLLPGMNWLERCRAAVADVKTVLAEMPDRDERERPIRKGKGGDMTAALDEAAETAALRHFDHDDVRIVSEEIGVKGSGRYQVLVDPIDGSQNAERGIPYFALSVAVADGDTIDDVFFGYVYDFGAGEEWTARRGRVPERAAADDRAEGLHRVPLDRGHSRRTRPRAAARAGAADRPRARDGRAGDHLLPPGRRPHRCDGSAAADARRRLRGGTAPDPRARVRDCASRRPRARRASARPRVAFARRRGGERGAMRPAGDGSAHGLRCRLSAPPSGSAARLPIRARRGAGA